MSDVAREGPNPIDKHVGARIRERRKELQMSQEKLAEYLGLTFQQVQKYERGANRVSASKLFEIAKALQASVAFFFEHLALPGDALAEGVAEQPSPEYRLDFIMTPEGQELAKAFPRIAKRKVRRQVLDLVKALAEDDDAA
jgi:transcriptional regulator with XRE-family HTH domain